MQKIASPRELQAELKSIIAFVHASEKPDRQVVASKLRELADRISGERFELVYGTGGTGGPYPDLEKAKAMADRLMKGNRNEVWIAIIPAAQSNNLANAEVIEYLHRQHGWVIGGMTMKQTFRGYF